MKNFAIALFALFLFINNSPAFAADCSDTAETQADMNACAFADFAKADNELNSTYKQLVKMVKENGDKEELQALIKAEKTWISFRDSECEYEAMGSLGGTIYPLEIASCKTNLTAEHTEALKKMLNDHL